MKTYGGVEVQVDTFLTLTQEEEEEEWSASRPGCFTDREKCPGPLGQEVGWAPEPVWSG